MHLSVAAASWQRDRLGVTSTGAVFIKYRLLRPPPDHETDHGDRQNNGPGNDGVLERADRQQSEQKPNDRKDDTEDNPAGRKFLFWSGLFLCCVF